MSRFSTVFFICDPWAGTVNLNHPIGVAITGKLELSSSTPIWWYPDVRSKLTKYLAWGSMCLNNCPEDSLDQWHRSISLFNFLKSVTILTADPSLFGTGKALRAHWLGSLPQGIICPASMQLCSVLSYIYHEGDKGCHVVGPFLSIY